MNRRYLPGIMAVTLAVTMPAAAVMGAQEEAGSAISTAAEYQAAIEEVLLTVENLNENDYTPESWQTLEDKAAAARTLLDGGEASSEELDACLLALNAVLDGGLVARTDREILNAAISEAKTVTDSTLAGYEELQSAIAEAEAVAADGNATELEIQAEAASCELACATVSGGIDKTALNDLISQAEALDTSAYDEASVLFFSAAVTSAKQVLENVDATQKQIDKHIQLLEAASKALYEKSDQDTVYDGTYQISGLLRHAVQDQDSMGNAALVKPFTLIKSGDDVRLRLEFVPLTTSLGSTQFTGYLAHLWYFPGWTDPDTIPSASAAQASLDAGNAAEEDLFTSGEEDTADAAETTLADSSSGRVEADVESWYDGVYDYYNDPDTGADENVKGSLYPHYATLPVELGQSVIWTQVYVPVMESINTGSGTQYARLILDWDTLTQVSGTETDKSALEAQTEEANSVLSAAQAGTGGIYQEQIDMLTQAIAAAQAVDANLNVSQEIVDNETDALLKAVNIFSSSKVDSDKSELKKAIEAADSYLNETDVKFQQKTLELLLEARNEAAAVYDDEEATQTEVNLCVTAIDTAIQNLIVDGTDKRELKKSLDSAAEVLSAVNDYSAAAIQALQSAYDTASAVYADDSASQEEADAQKAILDYIMAGMKKVTEVSVDKSSLHAILVTASNLAGRGTSCYTADSLSALNTAIAAAEAVYQDADATQSEVNAQVQAVSAAVSGLKAQTTSTDTDSGTTADVTSDSTTESSDGDEDDDDTESLDRENLADGVYSVTGSMVKIDKSTSSMSNEAINHTIKLTVSGGAYSLTMDFKGLTISGQLGYLGTLKYFKTGYTTDKYGTPSGSLGSVTVDSYQENEDGTKVSDSFGTDYPDVVTFPLISEALEDGYVPLQVFVPIMESISAGTGTQPVYLKLDWSTLEKTTEDDESFSEEDSTTTSTTTSSTKTTGTIKNTLSTGTGTGSTSTTKTTGTGTLGTSSLKSGTSTLKSTASTKTTALSSSLKSSGTSLNSKEDGISADADSNDASVTKLSSSGLSEADGTAGDSASSDAAGQESTKEPAQAKDVIPGVSGFLAALAGVVYKIRSRRFV